MFQKTLAFNQDLGDWQIGSVKSISFMFREAEAFNQDLGDWAVRLGNLDQMTYTFNGATAFNQALGWCVDDGVLFETDEVTPATFSDAFLNAPCAS